ncbi:hypothetical protein RFI_23989 [Reticulomyxa filosa]|uniref:Kelch motif family protein n=1 Tax=Reticulomyxa filosa TaxID=46433 RepID=X6MHR2_RETFI|nr:hypothetical protein RFI_23989 [Reticulomyxa filosa]|eukprot:ETO13384.1 hypothetical protein RFI_23989 [Reticulomyxa filosa]
MSNQVFQILKEFPIPLSQSQCVLHKHELIICGGLGQRACYSYHTLKNEYKFICEYPSNVELSGHCVSNQITLLSFGSNFNGRDKHTLVMKYVSVWSDISNKSNELSNYNQWIPFTDDHNNPIIIGRDQNYNYQGVRAVIGGSNNHLLFITHRSNDINVFNLNTFQFIKHDTLPIDRAIFYHCFVSKSENGQGQEMMKTNKQNYQMMLFCRKAGLSIEYDEDNNTFQFHKVPVSKDIALFYAYAYVCINDVILFFGGYGSGISKSVYKYSIRENKWMTFKNALPNSLYYCAATLNEENNDIYIIGGKDDKHVSVSTHMMTKMRLWDVSQLTKQEIKYIIEYWIRTSEINFGWIDDFDKIIIKFIILVIDATFLKFNRSKKKLFYHMNLLHTDFILLCIVDNQLSFFF